jgi:hypothetical protein
LNKGVKLNKGVRFALSQPSLGGSSRHA